MAFVAVGATGTEASGVATQVSATTGTFGDIFGDVATVTGSYDPGSGIVDPTGDVTFYYCWDETTTPATCDSSSWVLIDTITLDEGTVGDGSSTASISGWWAPKAGEYLLHAVYSGDSVYLDAEDDGTNEAISVALATSTTETAVSEATGTIGETFDDVATVTGTADDSEGSTVDPTGDVDFYYCWSPTATPVSCSDLVGTFISTVALVGGTDASDGIATATLATWSPAEGAGHYLLHAVYAGDEGYDTSSDDGTAEALHVFGTTVTQTVTDPTTATFGDTVSDTATVTGAASDGTGGKIDPTGVVEFYACWQSFLFPAECTSGTAGVVHLGPAPLVGGADATDGIATATMNEIWPWQSGFYLLHADYTGDTTYAGSGDDGTNETVIVDVADTTTVTQVSPTTGTDLDGFDDVATVTGAASDGDDALVDPTGFVTFSYCWSPTATPTTCFSGTEIGDPIALDGGADTGDGVATATLADWIPADGAGYYRFHADYTGDTGYAASGDLGANEAFWVRGTTTTTTVADPTTGGYLQHYSDLATVTGTASNGAGGTYDPTGWVRFYYCWSGTDTPSSCDASTGTPITTVRLAGGDDPLDGEATAGITDWIAPRSGWYLLHAVYLGDARYASSADDGTNEAITAAYSQVTYTGDGFHSTADGTSVLMNATIEAAPACLVGQVVYHVDDITGADVVEVSASGTSPQTLATIATSGIYEVTVSFLPTDPECKGASDQAVVAVVSAGDTASGGGWYKPEKTGFTWAGSPRVNYGFNVVKTTKTDRRTSVVTTTYRTNLVWLNKGQWRIHGSLTWSGTSGELAAAPYGVFDCPTSFLSTLPVGYTGAKCGSLKGSGILESWSDVYGWTPNSMFSPGGAITFTALMYDGGQIKVCKTTGKKAPTCTAKDNADWFGIQVDPVPTTALRESAPTITWGGSLKVN